MCFSQKIFEKNMQTVLTSIYSKLKALIESKPLYNKLLTQVLVFRYEIHERTSEFTVINMNNVS